MHNLHYQKPRVEVQLYAYNNCHILWYHDFLDLFDHE